MLSYNPIEWNIRVNHLQRGYMGMLEKFGDVLCIEELCEVLQIGKNSAYRLLQTGELSARRIGRIWRIPKTAVIDFLLRG